MKGEENYLTVEGLRKLARLARAFAIKPVYCEGCGKGFYSFLGRRNRIEECYIHETQDLAVRAITNNFGTNFI